ncbi:PTS system D-mannitol-specific IIB component (Fru family) /PTS system D-mannitol-specific IIC component (Fru family) [Streptohalobacillus salinus]|uniref:PTS system mannitol-specific EIICB component n=1 Tax=Streptohalobacillus salinus TaxID=621096 RepID=A0A2V3WDF1_9BACI|nr:PTS mannitol transporter subunit IICB [Streptohalobacillus salinus]PXW86819.1 PTS system D-mannitol-specific IIB component (Fru family) /PTS system D-mannitol-specific IIC component (Fru family) [Streptohalobacillus salinus]
MSQKGVRAKIQQFGSYLSGMVMPNIAAFIAWGLITALFIPDGWLPNEKLAELVGPMITYLLPLLIGFTGGKLVYDIRGGVAGAIATMGVIVGAGGTPMFLGAMIMGPLAAFLLKSFDKPFLPKIRSGFEMLYNNFSAGIISAVLAGFGVLTMGPTVSALNDALGSAVEAIVDAGLLPLASVLVEPAKILFLNNVINHGVFTPLGTQEAVEAGKSILFLIETNPGPGLGILLAFAVFGRGASKSSSYGAMLIHFIGGIHEIYFPYVLMKPSLILAAIAGGASGVLTFTLFDVGLTSSPSPGSIIALLTMTPRGNYLGVIAGVVIATAVSFLVASLILKASKTDDSGDMSDAAGKMEAMKGKKSSVAGSFQAASSSDKSYADVEKIVFACDAGMGSSAMGASLLRDKFKKNNIDIDVTNKAINDIPEDADLIITHKDLTDRAKNKRPDAIHVSVENFLNSPKYQELIDKFSK